MKLTIIYCIVTFLQVISPIQDSNTTASATPNTDTLPVIDTVTIQQLKIMEEQKGEPLTLKDTAKAVAGRYGFTLERGRRQLKEHNATAEDLIKQLDSIIKENE